MAVSLNPFLSWNMWGSVGGRRKKEKEAVSNGSSLNPSTNSEWNLGLVKENNKVTQPRPHRKVRRKRQDKREETGIDREFDGVFVASDDSGDWCFLSGSESDDSDWSIGWLEPLGSDFESSDNDRDDDESGADSFAVLVPCYTPGCKEVEGTNKVLLSALKNLPNGFASDGKNYMEQWLASLQGFGA
ncbi:unnamed protein product [Lathyrus oleraceus]|uniref:Uncharacterized protein n=1 Tax=Pisum sativum TaxID=3888 RepID=A0A9D5AUR0_PEA|nr:uncharacterized protein LOC127074967 [Pisum sativum]XP_050872348.1 uncharacterized protein LOC127074967 [Pisum sativum]XP_050872349.1 uncharacterized protein LOC127074967 [Pisum sativum]KAI5419300.1 hypothetical protein KIW84_043463 [Pisum sativum]